MWQDDPLYQMQDIQKTFQPSLNFIVNLWHKKLNLILKILILMIFLGKQLDDIFLCTIDVVGLYPNIPHDKALIALRKLLESREDKTISRDSLIDLAECVLKNHIFEHNLSFFKELRETAIGTKMAPPYAIIFTGDLEERILQNFSFKPLVRYTDTLMQFFYYGSMGRKNSKNSWILLIAIILAFF